MRSSGRVTALYNVDPALNRLIAVKFPAAQSAGSFFPLAGLTGLTAKIELGETALLARQEHKAQPIPGVNRRREYHILRQLAASGLAPAVQGYANGWLLLNWQPGENVSDLAHHLTPLIQYVAKLHQQPLSGHRLSILKLLEQYWLISRPDRRHYGWLKRLQRLQRQGEPKPLRLALLHMDIHPGNLIVYRDELKLIDWEYASDGDVALELAAIVAGNELSEKQQSRLTEQYASMQRLDVTVLHRQMQRWQPWLRLLMASWYELRWQQSGEEMFYTLAEKAWQRVLSD